MSRLFIDMKTPAKADTSPLEVHNHTWYGLTAHIYRKDKLVRCEIGHIVLDKCFVGIKVKWQENGNAMRKDVSPIYLMPINRMWETQTINISDDESGNRDTCVKPERLPDLAISMTEKSKFNEEQLRATQWMVEQTNQLGRTFTPIVD